MNWLFCFLFFICNLVGHEILTYGDAIIDYIAFVNEPFLESLPGDKGGSRQIDLETFRLLINNYHLKCSGGSSVNTMKGLALFGHVGISIGRIGNDPEGKEYVESLHSYGITPAFTEYDTYTGRVVSMVSPDGHRTMRSCIGSLANFEEFEVADQLFDGIKLFHAEGYQIPNPKFLKKLIARAKKEGALVSMDMGCHELVTANKEILLDLIENELDILFTNCDEAKALTGLAPEKACKELAKVCPLVVVTCGKEGGYVASGEKMIRYNALATRLVDDTGAGDCFMAGFLHGVLTNKSIEDCAHLGALIASKVIQLIGAELPKDLALKDRGIWDHHEVGIDFVAKNSSDGIECSSGS